MIDRAYLLPHFLSASSASRMDWSRYIPFSCTLSPIPPRELVNHLVLIFLALPLISPPRMGVEVRLDAVNRITPGVRAMTK